MCITNIYPFPEHKDSLFSSMGSTSQINIITCDIAAPQTNMNKNLKLILNLLHGYIMYFGNLLHLID